MATTKLRIYRDSARFLADARFALIDDETEIRHTFDDAWDECLEFVFRQAPWSFALKTAPLTNVVTPGGAQAYDYVYTRPTDWLRTHAIFMASHGREFPFDFREQAGRVYTNIAPSNTLWIRYVATGYEDPEEWPEQFAHVVAVYLAFLCAERITGDRGAPGRMSAIFSELFEQAAAIDALPEDPWFGYQRTGAFLRAQQAVMARGYWWWALKEREYVAGTDQLVTNPDYGFPYRYALPDDWFRTHSLFVPWDGSECPINIRESANDWSTDAETFVARYVSTDALDVTRWPEIVTKAVMAYLDWQSTPGEGGKAKEAEFDRLFTEALLAHSRKEDTWRRFQLDGSYIQAVRMLLEKGRWRFAVRTLDLTDTTDPLPAELADGTPSSHYAYHFIRPDDLLRTVWVYSSLYSGLGATRTDIDWRDEGGGFHANYSPITVRYVSRLGLDSTKWPANFRRAVHACLLHLERPDDPKLFGLFRDAEARAERLDDARDMPALRNLSRFTAGRQGGRGYSIISGPVVTTISPDALFGDDGDVLIADE